MHYSSLEVSSHSSVVRDSAQEGGGRGDMIIEYVPKMLYRERGEGPADLFEEV